MTSQPDKNTYAGQFASRKMLIKTMEMNSKQRIRPLAIQLGNLLTQKKALNSKVTQRHYEVFRDSIEASGDSFEIKSRLTRLEQALKQEGLFKNVKSDFGQLKKEIVGSLFWTENSQTTKQSLPGISSSTVAKDRTFYVAPKAGNQDNDQSAASGSTSQKQGTPMSNDDMRMLNSAIGKLYRHLQINAKDQETTKTEFHFKDESTQKENINILTLAHFQTEETFHDIVLKIRNFEKEFQRQKVQQHRDLMRMQEEIKRLNKNSNELRRENERIKGVQPIQTKAKGKQVERIEERYRSEKKGMEDKIYELESGMRKNIEQILHDKTEGRTQFRTDVDNIMSSMNMIHEMLHGHGHDAASGSHDNDTLPTKKLLNVLTSIATGVKQLKSKNSHLSSNTDELSAWKKSLKDVDREIVRFCRTFDEGLDDTDWESSIIQHDNERENISFSCKTKLQKCRENINRKLKGVTDNTSSLKRKDREVQKYKRNLDELHAHIAKLHDHVMSVQMQDISIAMPSFERRHDGDRSDGSADELPEADQQEQNDVIDKLKQTETMVTHFQQLIIDRTGTLNKMENDMLPLKIRVNRLHEEISKAMTDRDSPDHDPADDIVRPKRGSSPESSSSVVSREISNMLKKLSKMELTIRHLLEQHGANHGRASI